MFRHKGQQWQQEFDDRLAERRAEGEKFWARIAERDRQARIARAQREKELIKQAVREVLDERGLGL